MSTASIPTCTSFAVIKSKSGRKSKSQTRFLDHFDVERVIAIDSPAATPVSIDELTASMFPDGSPKHHEEVDGSIVISWCVFEMSSQTPKHLTIRVPRPTRSLGPESSTLPRTKLDSKDRENLLVTCFGGGDPDDLDYNKTMCAYVSSIRVDRERAWAVCIPTDHPHLDQIVASLPLQRLVDHGNEMIPYVLKVRFHNGKDGSSSKHKSGVVLTQTLFHSMFWETSLQDKCDIFAPVASTMVGMKRVRSSAIASTSGHGGLPNPAVGMGKGLISRSAVLEQADMFQMQDTRLKMSKILDWCVSDTSSKSSSIQLACVVLGALFTMDVCNTRADSQGAPRLDGSLSNEGFHSIIDTMYDTMDATHLCAPCDVFASLFTYHMDQGDDGNVVEFVKSFDCNKVLVLLGRNLDQQHNSESKE